MPRQLLAYTDSPVKARDERSSRYLQTMPLFNGYKHWEAPQHAAEIAGQLERTPTGRRAVTPFYILAYVMKAAEYPVDPVAIFERGEIDTTRDVACLGHLGETLRRRGIELDLVYCDNECDLTPWTFGLDKIREVYRSKAARDRMPDDALRFDVDKLVFPSPEYHEWLLAFGRHAKRIKVAALRKTLIESGLISPWNSRPAAANFFTVRTSFRIYDYNGWEYENDALVDNVTSCPIAMLAARGHRYKGRQHHPLWNSFVDLINHARSGGARGPIVPVIREPLKAVGQAPGTVDEAGAWLLDQLIGHLVRTAADRFMYFHAHAGEADDRAIAAMLARHEDALPESRPALAEVRLDVDEVVTGDWRTSYAEFLSRRPERWDLNVP